MNALIVMQLSATLKQLMITWLKKGIRLHFLIPQHCNKMTTCHSMKMTKLKKFVKGKISFPVILIAQKWNKKI